MAYRAASDASRTLREPSTTTTTTTTIITHSRQRSQASESTDYTLNLPPSKKDTTSLKHAESVRIAIMTRHSTNSTPTRKTINDNNNGKQVKSVRVECEEHTRISSLVSGRDTVSKRLKIQFTGWRVACLSSARRR
jgi:hypothetical protein